MPLFSLTLCISKKLNFCSSPRRFCPVSVGSHVSVLIGCCSMIFITVPSAKMTVAWSGRSIRSYTVAPFSSRYSEIASLAPSSNPCQMSSATSVPFSDTIISATSWPYSSFRIWKNLSPWYVFISIAYQVPVCPSASYPLVVSVICWFFTPSTSSSFRVRISFLAISINPFRTAGWLPTI